MIARIKKTVLLALGATLASAAIAAPAPAAFGLKSFDVEFLNRDGTPATQAGSKPYAQITSFALNTTILPNPSTGELLPAVEGKIKDIAIEQLTGFIGDSTLPTCRTADFLTPSPLQPNSLAHTACPDIAAIGIAETTLFGGTAVFTSPIYYLVPPVGVAARLGFRVEGIPAVVDIRLKDAPEYNLVASSLNINAAVEVFAVQVMLWGIPADPAHDFHRGNCANGLMLGGVGSDFFLDQADAPLSGPVCPTNAEPRVLLDLPRSCVSPTTTSYETASWEEPNNWVTGSVDNHDDADPPNPQLFTGCAKLPFEPQVASQATTDSAETSTGLDFSIDFDQKGLTSTTGLAQSEIKKTVVTLPEGVTVNPSIGEGLEVCSPAQLARETLSSAPGEGCPNGSKIGSVSVESPLLREFVKGSVFLAQQDDPGTSQPGAENPFDSMLAFHIVLKHPGRGILVKVPAKVEPHPRTGQLVTTVDDIPQTPFSRFDFHFREGQRAPLVSPPACGTYETKTVFTPWARPSEEVTAIASFQITEGRNDGPCPPGGVPPFSPGFQAGAINNNAASYSPFYMRLIREDGEQDMTKFSSVLPPGVLGNLSGVDKCSEAGFEAAKGKTGREELASPSCPANSKIGRTLAGAGVGSALTYVPGEIYLAGPYKGAPLSVIAITPAVAGPFDAGTVVVREALTLNPKTAEVEVDGAASDPIPHILQGIPLKVRDLRVYVDRDKFIVNPTSCDPSEAKATLFGGFLDVFSPDDDVPVDLATRFQVANCLNLGFKPRLKLNLRGGAKRGDHPGLKAELNARPGDANISGAVVTLPRSAFLEQGHIRTICTRVQFAAEQCPKAAQYGFARAFTPLLEEPLEGPVYLRSSSNKLPDLVVDLQGLVDVEVSARIDSFKGGIRSSFEATPDAPVSKFILTMQGGKKGLIVNSRNLCAGKTSRVNARFLGHNGRATTLRPKLQPQCGKKRKGKRR